MERSDYFQLIFILALGLATYLFGSTVLYRNWDVLPYMATILTIEGDKSIEEIHHQVFVEAERHIPTKQYNKLIAENDSYRKTIYENPKHLEEQLPFYMIKPLYVFASYLSYKIGFNLAYATTFPSALSYVLISLLLFYWLSSILPKHYALILCLLFIFIPPLNKLSRYGSPDGLSNLFLLLGIYLFMVKEIALWKVNMVFALAILTRSDNVIYALLFNGLWYVSEWLKYRPKHITFIVSVAALFACYIIPQLLMKPPGWSVLFYHTFIEPSGTPLSNPPVLTADEYLAVFSVNTLKIASNLFLYLLLGGGVLFIPKAFTNLWQQVTREQVVFIAIIGTACAKFILFPVFWDRMYLAFNIVLTVLIISYLYARFGNARKPSLISFTKKLNK